MGSIALEEPIPGEPVDPNADLSSVLPMTACIREDHLWVGGVDMVELARSQGTALYVMDEEQIRHQLREFREWTSYHWTDVETVYAALDVFLLPEAIPSSRIALWFSD